MGHDPRTEGLVPRFKPTSHRWVDRSRERRSRRRATARASVFSATRRGEGVRVTLCRDIATREREGSARAMGAFEGVDSGARAVSTRDDDASGGGSGRTENRVVANAMRSSSRIRARADGDAYAEAEMMMSQRETVTYHAPAAASGHPNMGWPGSSRRTTTARTTSVGMTTTTNRWRDPRGRTRAP